MTMAITMEEIQSLYKEHIVNNADESVKKVYDELTFSIAGGSSVTKQEEIERNFKTVCILLAYGLMRIEKGATVPANIDLCDCVCDCFSKIVLKDRTVDSNSILNWLGTNKGIKTKIVNNDIKTHDDMLGYTKKVSEYIGDFYGVAGGKPDKADKADKDDSAKSTEVSAAEQVFANLVAMISKDNTIRKKVETAVQKSFLGDDTKKLNDKTLNDKAVITYYKLCTSVTYLYIFKHIVTSTVNFCKLSKQLIAVRWKNELQVYEATIEAVNCLLKKDDKISNYLSYTVQNVDENNTDKYTNKSQLGELIKSYGQKLHQLRG